MIRYMDDYVIFHESKEYLKECLIKIKDKLINTYKLNCNMKKTNIKSRIEIINAGFYASYINSDKIRFSSTYKNISSVEQLYFSISRNADTV